MSGFALSLFEANQFIIYVQDLTGNRLRGHSRETGTG